MNRVLNNTFKKNDEIFYIKQKKYYKLIFFIIRSRSDIINDLLKCLNSSDFTIKIKYFYIFNDVDVSVKKMLEQIFFMNKFQEELIKRFYNDFLLQMNVTFNINVLKMFFFVTVRVINIHLIFSVAFSFIMLKNEMIINFFIQCLQKKMFNDYSVLRVIIIDQRKKIQVFLLTKFFTIYKQFC